MLPSMKPAGTLSAQLHWLWVLVSDQVTVCDILPGRGFDGT
jgi:hypothetical protein